MNNVEFHLELNEVRKQAKTLLENWIKQAAKSTIYMFKDDKAKAQKVLIKINKAYLNAISCAHLNDSETALKKLFDKYVKITDKALDTLT